MRKLIAGSAIFAMIALISGCSGIPGLQSAKTEQQITPIEESDATGQQPAPTGMAPTGMAPMGRPMTRQDIKIYDVLPQYGRPLGQISSSLCDGTKEAATNRLLDLTLQRGGNGMLQLSCTSEGMSFSCWSKANCTAMAIKVEEPPPPPPPPKKRAKAKPKKNT